MIYVIIIPFGILEYVSVTRAVFSYNTSMKYRVVLIFFQGPSGEDEVA